MHESKAIIVSTEICGSLICLAMVGQGQSLLEGNHMTKRQQYCQPEGDNALSIVLACAHSCTACRPWVFTLLCFIVWDLADLRLVLDPDLRGSGSETRLRCG